MSSLPGQAPISPPPSERAGLLGMRVRLGTVEISFPQVCIVAAIVFYSLAIPGDLDYKLDALGFGVCHQIAEHSFFVDGHQLPLCARCSGIYLSALASLGLLLVIRRRAARLPVGGMVAILAVFFGAMVLDGINSTLQTFGSNIWESTNLVRLITGSLAGTAVAFFLYPVFNMSVWSREVRKRESVLESPIELAGYMLVVGLVVALVLDQGDWLFYPLSFLSIIGMLAMLTMANTMLVLIMTRREGKARTFSEALTPILIAFLLSLIEITLLSWGRASLAPYMANNVGMPLVPGLP
ncbi:MAG TPA: DUF2085 domain-containing protein [Chloroflexia bacterium]